MDRSGDARDDGIIFGEVDRRDLSINEQAILLANEINENELARITENNPENSLELEDIEYLKEIAIEKFGNLAEEQEIEFTNLAVTGERNDENPKDENLREIAGNISSYLGAEVIVVLDDNIFVALGDDGRVMAHSADSEHAVDVQCSDLSPING